MATKKKKVKKSNKRTTDEFIIEESVIEYTDANENSDQDNPIPISRGTTTTHFIKFINFLLDVMDLDENSKL
ncbi:hypothetical protein BCV72DRAFT_329275 [Rhizopus microsporus var. microsporus]|uniref:Uncharacterized protein n=1 Tax=Rhizopus microsporus var. microsporus TaxID=86635 RepID=A0A1X0R2J9_RHIZD|nr:hypothetical protein BCV72DRAFT_329275 [Rhizopus microsporus var. microsporus]